MHARFCCAALAALFATPLAAQSPPLASQEIDGGIVAEVTEFKRKGNTLTAKVRYRLETGESVTIDLAYDKTYVLDAANGRKYEILRDDAKNYIAALGPSYTDRYWNSLTPGKPLTVWMKFPAPPADVTAVTLQIDGAPPFDDLAIQD